MTLLTAKIRGILDDTGPAAPYVQYGQEMLALMHLKPSSTLAWQDNDFSFAREGNHASRLLSFTDRHLDLAVARRSH
jgi:hypothetical protein